MTGSSRRPSARLPHVAPVALLILSVAAACGGGGEAARRAASATGGQDSLPLPAARLITLAAEAEARLDSASRVRSGPRICGAGGGQPSAACELELAVRVDTDSIPLDRIPGGFVVIAVIRNVGDSTESRTSIPARTTAYALIQQGGPQRTTAWYFSIDQAARSATFIRRLSYSVCPQPHADAGQVRAAFRTCAAPAGALAVTTDEPPPIWIDCLDLCCLLDNT